MKKNNPKVVDPPKLVCIAECNYPCCYKQFPVSGNVDLRDLQYTSWCEKENHHVNENQQA